MDEHRFDDLTRALATATTRRTALKALGGGLLGGLLASFGGNAEAKRDGDDDDSCMNAGQRCRSDRQCCSGDCKHGHCAALCRPTTCAAQGVACGHISDGCGGTLHCGSCSGGTACSPVSCHDGQCVHKPIAGCCANNADCTDNNACTTDTCVHGTCKHAPINCQPSDACHTASCDPVQGCVQTPVSDGTGCGGGKTCQSGACGCPSGTKDCGGTCQQCCAANDCPGTTCSPATCTNGTCGRAPIAGCCASDADCDNGSACTTDTCDTSTNTCQHVALDCQPIDVCHTASCDPVQGCVQTPLSDGTACGNGLTCRCGVCSCVDDGTACQGKQCGSVTNNCGQTASCGTCANGATCTNGTCVASDPCAGVTCGACQICSGGGCVADPSQNTVACTTSGGQAGICQSGTCQPTLGCDCRNLNYCSGHGTCQPDCTCTCDAPYSGVACTDLPVTACVDITTCTDCQASNQGCVWCSQSINDASGVCTPLSECIIVQPSCAG